MRIPALVYAICCKIKKSYSPQKIKWSKKELKSTSKKTKNMWTYRKTDAAVTYTNTIHICSYDHNLYASFLHASN